MDEFPTIELPEDAEVSYLDESLWPAGIELTSQAGCCTIGRDTQYPTQFANIEDICKVDGQILAARVSWSQAPSTPPEQVTYRLPNAWGWRPRTVRIRQPRGVIYEEVNANSISTNPIVNGVYIFMRDGNYGITNGSPHDAWIEWKTIEEGGGGSIVIPRNKNTVVSPVMIRILKAEIEPD